MADIVVPTFPPSVNLNGTQALVDAQGRATPYLLRYLFDQDGYLTQGAAELASLIEQLNTLKVQAGGALTVTPNPGLLTSNPTISLDALSPDPSGSYTNLNATINEYGQVVAAANGSGGGGARVTPNLYPAPPLITDPSLTQVGVGGKYGYSGGSGWLTVQYTGSGATPAQIAGFLWPIASTTCEIAIYMAPSQTVAQYYGPTVGFHNTANGRYYCQGLLTTVGLSYTRWAAVNNRTNVDEPLGQYVLPPRQPIWFHLKCDGTTMSMGISGSGYKPIYLRTETLATYLSTFDRVFIGGFFENTTESQNTSFTCMCYDDTTAASRSPVYP